MRRGVTLLEILLVLGVASIFLAVGTPSLRRLQAHYELQNAQRSLVEILNRARSEARRSSVDHTLNWTSSGLELKREDELVTNPNFSESITLTRGNKTSGKLTYSAPYGRVSATDQTYKLEHNNSDKRAIVIVYGLTGKVKAVAP